MTTYIPKRGDFAVLKIKTLSRAASDVHAVYVVDSHSGEAGWVTENGSKLKLNSPVIQKVTRVRVAANKPDAPAFSLEDLVTLGSVFLTKKKEATDVWSTITDIVSNLYEQDDEPEEPATIPEPMNVGAVVISDGIRYVLGFRQCWYSESGRTVRWDDIKNGAVLED